MRSALISQEPDRRADLRKRDLSPHHPRGPLHARVAAGLLLPALLLLGGCQQRGYDYLGRLQAMEPAGYAGESPRDSTRELEREIARYRGIVEQKVAAQGKLGTYYRMLAVRCMDRRMFGPAYQALQEAIDLTPANPILFSMAGVSAAQMSRGYGDALYGLAILLVFERADADPAGRTETLQEACGLVGRLLEGEKLNVEALFLKGQIEYRLGSLEEAIEAYDRITRLSRSEAKRAEELYGRR